MKLLSTFLFLFYSIILAHPTFTGYSGANGSSGMGDISFYVSGLQENKNGPNTKGLSTISEGVTTGIQENESVPLNFSLGQNYPNPFNPTTTIQYSISQKGLYSLKVYNVIGKEVATLLNDEINAGTFIFTFNASNLPSGVYFYTLSGDNFLETRKMILMK